MSEVTVWFDGDCPLCRREIALMRRLDRRRAVTFIEAHSGGETCPVSRADLLAQFHASENGQLLSGAAAFAALWRAIPLLRPIGVAARWPPMLRLLERAYLIFLRVRPALQSLARRLESRETAS